METDERFKHLATDPRFKTLRKKQRKVQIDERFQSMFTDDKFTLKYSKDKRGRHQKKTSGDDLKRYYSLEQEVKRPIKEITEKDKEEAESSQEEEESEEEEDDRNTRVDNEQDEEENEDEEQDAGVEDDANETPESELSSSSDESDSEVEEDDANGNEVDIDKIEYNWQPLDHDAKTANISTKRLAIQNLDWDRLDVKDLYTLVNSIRPPMSVKIYVSEFGKKRLKDEELHGPKEIVEMPNSDDDEEEEYKLLESKMKALENPKPKAQRVHEYEDADDELNPKNEEIRDRIRRYQLSRMKYYYAVAEFDSIDSAELVYKELDGMEYEGSSLELDLRFIPEDMKFDEADMKAECNKLPDLTTYKAPQFISTALQQTTVKFTWDETDIKRQEKLHKAYTKEELEKDDLEAYLASETDSEEEEEEVENFNDTVSVVTANSEARVNKYKQLLKSLEEEENKKKKVDVDIEWGNFSEDEQKQDDEEGEKGESVDSDDNEASFLGSSDQEEESMKRDKGKRKMDAKRKKEKRKLDKRKGKKKRGGSGDCSVESDNELDLLVMDTSKKHDEFKFDPDDDRFRAVYESGLYNVDPSHPNFKRTQAFDLIAEKKREKRRKTSS